MICKKNSVYSAQPERVVCFFFGIMERAGGSLSSGLGSVGQNAATRSGNGSSAKAH